MDMQSDEPSEGADATGSTKKNTGKKRGNSQNLLPWQKGISGNPSGRPKKFFEIQALAQQKSVRAFERICELVESDDERIAFMASKEVCDRAWGKVNGTSDENDKSGKVTINIVKLAVGERPEPPPKGGQVITLKRFSDA
jgi:hypothetical protein